MHSFDHFKKINSNNFEKENYKNMELDESSNVEKKNRKNLILLLKFHITLNNFF